MKLKFRNPDEEINNSARLIFKYFQLQESSKVATLIYQVHVHYCKEGDFVQLDTLVNLQKEQFITENTLEIITVELETIFAQVNKFDSFAESLLKTFLNHPNFILWARATLKDTQQVKVFVDLALTSCDVTDFDINRITCLRSVCNTLAPLIFDMSPNCNYDQFINLFNQVNDQIVDKDRFLKTFNEAANLLHIWKHLEIAHSSVGKSTIQELTDIFEVGYFEVNLDNNSGDGNIHLYIQHSPISRVYNLENLKDLQSKIALIKAESNATQHIKLFTSIFGYITEISLMVEKLKYLGHISYVNYVKQFKCQAEAIPILKSEIELGNAKLNTWSVTLDFAHNKFYSLNFFTDLQILILRRDLNLFQREAILNPQIIHLLSMLNPNVTKQEISRGLATILDSLSSEQSESQPMADSLHEEIVDNSGSPEPFPDTFNETDRQFCQSICVEEHLDLTLCIIGIQQLKRDSNDYDETDLLEFCLNSTALIGGSSEEIEVDTTSSVDSKLDQSLHNLIRQSDQMYISLEILSILDQTPDALMSLLKHFPKLHYTHGERKNTLIQLMIVQDNNGETSLHYAVKTEDLLYVQIIHENAPNQQTFLSIRNLNGDTALHLAIQNGNIEVTNFLLQSKSPFYPHKDDKSTILHIAVEFLDSVKRMVLIETILKNEPEPSSDSDRIITRLKNHNGYTPLHLAIERKYSDVVNILLDVDIGAMYIRDDNERTPLHLAIIPSFSDGQKCTEVSTIHQPILDSVLNACEKLDGKHEENAPCSAKHLICIQDKHKRTAMHDAIQHLNVYAFTELLKTGSCLDIPDEEGNILTHEAVKNPDDITYRILLVEELKRRYPDTLYDCFQ
ncbi:E3 ubiquitin-protein ligase [Oopsacas minuta]|uniref:E3 ubiquitin-protein ligase n=1 Tax=Oopsacas minuta TaxID=111878 RepID=A0AAV7KKM3_9METZ|nr:E3 ubiquitin-protein ligase [Oopsacas minuta]